MTIRWHPQALAEAAAAARFSRERDPNLAVRFVDSIEEAVRRVRQHPQIDREVEPGVRKCRLKACPYALVFRVGPDLQALALMHVRQAPGHWQRRI